MFRTYEPQRDRLVAVKAFRLDLVPEAVAQLAESLRRLAGSRLKHPAIVAALDAGLEGTIAYLAMEYVAAETLDVALRHLAPAPIDRAWPILGHIAEAIDAGWAAGQGHGALHPRDVFVTPGTQDVRVSGFGVLHTLEQVGVKAPLRRPYTAPERVAGEPFDITADVYSLGAIAHELLTGRRPAGPGEQDGAMTSGTTPEQRVLIRKILAGALAERPRDRFPTAGAFVAALRDVARGEPVGPLPIAAETAAEPPRFSPSRTITPEWKDGKPVPPPAADAPLQPPPPKKEERALPLIAAAEEEDESDSVIDEEPPREAPAARAEEEELDEPVAAKEETPVEPAAIAAEPAPVVSAPSIWQPPPPKNRPAVETYSSYIESEPPPSYPWLAIAAIGIAGVVLGLVIGYRIGSNRVIPGPVAPAPAAAARPADTEVPVRTEPTPPPAAVAPPPAVTAPQPPNVDTRAAEPSKPHQAAPSPAPAQASTKPATTGRLLVRSVPAGATIAIDGHPRGVTPVTVRDLTLGTHTIQVSHAGYLTKTESVTLTANDPARNLIVDLGPKRQVGR